MTTLPPLRDSHQATRDALHVVAEQVLAAARWTAVGKIGLTPAPGGFATPAFPGPAGRRVVAVDGTDLVVLDDGVLSARTALTSVGAAAAVVGIEPAHPGTYQPVTRCEPDRPLDLDAASAATIGAWFDLGRRVLASVCEQAAPPDDVSAATLWPEHFDLALVIGADGARANVGASPGDGGHEAPYLYVGPWQPPAPDSYWNATTFTGALLSYDEVAAAADPDAVALAFVRRGLALLSAPI